MNIHPAIRPLEEEMSAWRRHLHAHPELGLRERATARFVADKLHGWGIDTTEAIGLTGVVGTLKGARGPGPAIGIRAELDALPITEETGLDHASLHPGLMHACGHDGHMAMLLGAACALARTPDFAGIVHFIFQPAEEGLGGALAMLEDGLFDRFPCDEIYALHNSERPLGEVVIHDSTVAAAADRFEIVVEGRGGHAAAPHLAIDPLPIAARLLLDIEALPGRLTNAMSPAVVTVGALNGGTAFNVIPATATLEGTARYFEADTGRALQACIKRLAQAHAAMRGARARIAYKSPFAPTVNTPEMSHHVARAAIEVVGAKNVIRDRPPEMGSEDFSFMLQRRPGCYFLLGQGDEAHTTVPHDPRYDYNDALSPLGASIWLHLVEQRLAPQEEAGE